MKSNILSLILLLLACSASAQRETVATRIHSTVKIDGVLDEAAWNYAVKASDFTQFEPVVNAKPSGDTEVRVIYDNQGLYIGAHMMQEPSTILKELSVRDNRGNTDWFGITIDPYQGGLNGFAYIVTASGVQQDLQFAGEEEDRSWDAVWESAVSFVDDGWILEVKIPYSAIRFPDKDIQEWNIQFGREIRHIREQSFWSPIDPNIDGFINQCGKLSGIRDIKTPIRLQLTPFVVGYLDHDAAASPGNQTSTAFGAGMDLKYGINDAFTLDMTLIPDFGAVVSDNVVVNLGPFEQFFEENRAFFTEGIELFNKGNLFYTRRIGGRPLNRDLVANHLQNNESITSNPGTTQLLNATKVSGRTSNGTGIGVFNAVVSDEYAEITNALTGATREVKTNPYTNYNVFVIDQNLANNSVVSFVNTNALRFGEDYDANVTGVFFDFKNESQNYGIGGKFVLSQKYYSDSTDLGHSYGLYGGKIGGKFRSTLGLLVETENYDHNDLGFLFSPNEQSIELETSYNEYEPKSDKLVKWRIYLNQSYNRLYQPNLFTNYRLNTGAFVLFKTRFAMGLQFNIEPIETNDYFEPRSADFSKFYLFPRNYRSFAFVSSDYRKPFAYDIRVGYRKFDEVGRYELIGEFEPRVRFNNHLSLFGTLTLGTLPNQIGYVDASIVDGPISGIEGDDVMFGRRDRVIFDNSLRLNYIFTNTMSLSLRARHYWDRFKYNQFSRVEADGSLGVLAFDGNNDEGNPHFDRNNNIFNIDLFYTWRFAPGSDIVFAWKNAVFTSDKAFEGDYFSNLSNTFNSDQFNSLSLRIIYFLDYNELVTSRSSNTTSISQ